jgi:ribosomal protein S18 acetylase RimI-like enzyme
VKTDPARDYLIEPLGDHHDRSVFTCGIEPLDQYFRDRAGQDMRRNISASFVLVHRATQAICGFYTLANAAIAPHDLPPEVFRKLPKYPFVPATVLGRLAVDARHQGKGLGEFILIDALRRSRAASDQVASFAVVVDAKDEQASAFYRKYGFRPLASSGSLLASPSERLFLPMRTIGQLFP